MKKILNEPFAYVDEMLEGLCLAHPQYYKRIGPQGRVIVRADGPVKGKVGIVSGGGSGHLPVFTGYVGKGLLDACAIGDVFSSPAVDQVAEAIRAAHGGAGVLRLYGNYGGDNMNFDMAGEMVEMEDIRTTTVRVADDVASAPPAERSKRRGVAGLVYAYKIAGAKADQFATLEQVTAIAEEMLSYLLADRPLQSGERVSILVNSLGATPPEELYIVYRYVARKLAGLGAEIVMPLVGRYATSMEMAGMSLTFCNLDGELEALLKAPCDCPFLRI